MSKNNYFSPFGQKPFAQVNRQTPFAPNPTMPQTKTTSAFELSQRKEYEFRLFYNHTIYPELVRLNRLRIKMLISVVLTLLLFIGASIAFFSSGNLPIAILTGFPLLFFGWSTITHYQNYALVFKPRIVKLILDFLDDYVNCETLDFSAGGNKPFAEIAREQQERYLQNLRKKNQKGEKKEKPKSKPKQTPSTLKQVMKKHFWESGFYPHINGDIYESEDFITGRIGSVPFELCEVRVERASRVNTNLFVLFQGIFLHATLETQNLRGQLLIIPREKHEFFWESIQQAVKNGMREVDKWIRNQEFRQHYLTYANKEVAIRRILPEDMQAAIMAYRQKTGKEIYLAFKKNHAYLAMPRTKDLLEPPYFRSVARFDLIHEFYTDISALLALMEDFDKFH